MSDNEDGWSRLILGLRGGNSLIVREFCDQYGEALQRLADKHLAEKLRRRVGPEDVVQSACRTFLRRVQAGEFKLADSEALWGVLCAITLTKVREQARFHLRHKRGLDREMDAKPLADESGAGWDFADRQPTPFEAAEFADQFQNLLSGLDEEERQVVDLKLQEFTNAEVAEQLGRSERTVRRILNRLQEQFTKILAEA